MKIPDDITALVHSIIDKEQLIIDAKCAQDGMDLREKHDTIFTSWQDIMGMDIKRIRRYDKLLSKDVDESRGCILLNEIGIQ